MSEQGTDSTVAENSNQLPLGELPKESLSPRACDRSEAGMNSVDAQVMSHLERARTYLLEDIKLADSKASYLLASVTAITSLTIMASISIHQSIVKNSYPSILAMTLIAFVAFLASILLVLWPRGRAGIKRTHASLLFGPHILKHGDSAAYVQRLREVSDNALLENMAEDCWRLATIGRRKYGWLRIAIIAAVVSVGVSVGTLSVSGLVEQDVPPSHAAKNMPAQVPGKPTSATTAATGSLGSSPPH